MRLYETEAAPGNYPFTGPDFLDWKNENHTFQDMTLIGWPHAMNLSGQGEPDNVVGNPAEANFFDLLGALPLFGRTFVPGEDEPGHDREVVLSYGLWQSHFGGDRKIVGSEVELNGEKQPVEVPVKLTPAGSSGVRATFSFPVSLDALKVERPELLFVKVDDKATIKGELLFEVSAK